MIGDHPSRSSFRIACVLAVLCSAVSVPARASEAASSSLKPESLRLGFDRRIFLGINEADAQAAFKAFVITSARKRGYDLQVSSTVYDDAKSMEAAIKAGVLDLFVVESWTYLGMNISAEGTPHFTSVQEDGLGKAEILLVRSNSLIHSIPDLRGMRLVEYAAANALLGRHWLETVLLEQKLGNCENFFGTIESVTRPSAAVLPVFFGKKDACVVDRASFDILKEMNPQLGRELCILAASEPLIHAVTCLKNSGWSSPRFKQDLIEAVLELRADAAGQQILLVFKTPRIVAFREEHLQSLRELFSRHQRLRADPPGGAETPGHTRMESQPLRDSIERP